MKGIDLSCMSMAGAEWYVKTYMQLDKADDTLLEAYYTTDLGWYDIVKDTRCMNDSFTVVDSINQPNINDIKYQCEILKHKLNTMEKNECENVFHQQQIETAVIDHSLSTDKMQAECDNLISTYVTTLNDIKLQFENNMYEYQKDADRFNKQLCIFSDIILNTEWNILQKFVNNMFAYGLYHSKDINRYNNHDMIGDGRNVDLQTNTTGEVNDLVKIHNGFVYFISESGDSVSVTSDLKTVDNPLNLYSYDECFICISHGKYGSTLVSSNCRVECYVQDNTNNGCKSSLYVCMLLGYLVCSNMQRLNSQRRIYDDCG